MMGVFLLSLAVKGTVVLALGAAVAGLLRRSSASLRHGVWAATFVALLAVPILGAIGPSWRVAVLPSAASAMSDAPSASPAETESRPSVDRSAVPPLREPLVGPVERVGVTPGGVVTWLSRLWALGVLAVGLGWLRGFVLGRRLVWASRVVEDEVWSARLRTAAQASGLEEPVRLRRSEALSVPVAWGWGRPTVVLPPQSEAWDAERAESVLLHEMAHLRRRDAWTQGIAQAALALHWPNPLAWLAYRRFLTAREQACDDAVLRVGAAPTTYASHLVAAARELSPARWMLAAVSPLIGPDELETRVRAILDGQRRRGPVGRGTTGAALVLAFVVVGSLAAFQPVTGQHPPATTGAGLDGRVTSATVTSNTGTVGATSVNAERDLTPTTRATRQALRRPDGSLHDAADRDTTDRDTLDVRRVRGQARQAAREAEAVQRQADEARRMAAQTRREADAMGRTAAGTRRQADETQRVVAEVEREAARAQRAAAETRQRADEVAREAAQVLREADAVRRDAARVVREADVTQRDAARVLREARVVRDST